MRNMMKKPLILLAAAASFGMSSQAHAQDVELAMNCWEPTREVWQRYEKVGETIRAVEGEMAGEPDPITEADEANQKYIFQVKTYAGKFNIEVDYKNLQVIRNSVTGQQILECKS